MISKEKPYFVGNVLMCGISNINAGCSGNMGKNLEIDLDNFNYSIDIVPTCGRNIYSYQDHFLDLDSASEEKLKKLYEELEKLNEEISKKSVNDADYKDIFKKIEDKDQEIKKVKSGKFFFMLKRVDGKESYMICYKKTNINIKGYKKAKEEFSDIINLYKKLQDSKYDGGSDLTTEELEKLNNFYEKNKELFILYKVTYLEKKVKDSDKSKVVEYSEIIDIYKKQ